MIFGFTTENYLQARNFGVIMTIADTNNITELKVVGREDQLGTDTGEFIVSDCCNFLKET